MFVWKSAVTAAAAVAPEELAERSVFKHTVRKRYKDRPAASRKDARREQAAARSQNEQDNKNPKIAVVTPIHKFPPSPQRICIVFLPAVFILNLMPRRYKMFRETRVHLVAKRVAICYNFVGGHISQGKTRKRFYPKSVTLIHFVYGYRGTRIRWR